MASDLQRAGAEVSAYDPGDVATPDGVRRFVHPALAVRSADVVLGVTGGADAKLALLQSLEAIRSDALYADLSTSSPNLKSELAHFADRRALDFADVALMSMVPGNGMATPSLVSGTGAQRYRELFGEYGGHVDMIDGPAGSASAKKLLRSVMMKGMAAVLLETVRAGAVYDDLEWLWDEMGSELAGADEEWIRRLITGAKTHARRRLGEMEAAADMLEAAEVAPIMTRAAAASLSELMMGGDVPELPRPVRDPNLPSPRSAADRSGDQGEFSAGD